MSDEDRDIDIESDVSMEEVVGPLQILLNRRVYKALH